MQQTSNTQALRETDRYTGKGVGIAILDTGISPVEDFTMPRNRILVFRDFIHGGKHPYDDNGHGTHVTGIACGNGWLSDGKYCGTAPLSHIIALKILDAHGQGNSAKAIQAMRWIMDNAASYHIKVVNLSIGTNDRKVHVPLMEAVERLWHMGIVVVAAAGNPDGRDGYLPPPSLSPKILSVGAWEDKKYFAPPKGFARFTGTSSGMPGLWAPGEDIISVLSPDYNFSLQNRGRDKTVDQYYIRMSGASMATPFVSGAAACLLEKYPEASPAEVKRMLCSAAEQNGGLLPAHACL